MENDTDRELKKTLELLLGLKDPQEVIIKAMFQWVEAVRTYLSDEEIKTVISHLSDAFQASGFTRAAYDKEKTREQLLKFLMTDDETEHERLINKAKIARHVADRRN